VFNANNRGLVSELPQINVVAVVACIMNQILRDRNKMIHRVIRNETIKRADEHNAFIFMA